MIEAILLPNISVTETAEGTQRVTFEPWKHVFGDLASEGVPVRFVFGVINHQTVRLVFCTVIQSETVAKVQIVKKIRLPVGRNGLAVLGAEILEVLAQGLRLSVAHAGGQIEGVRLLLPPAVLESGSASCIHAAVESSAAQLTATGGSISLGAVSYTHLTLPTKA